MEADSLGSAAASAAFASGRHHHHHWTHFCCDPLFTAAMSSPTRGPAVPPPPAHRSAATPQLSPASACLPPVDLLSPSYYAPSTLSSSLYHSSRLALYGHAPPLPSPLFHPHPYLSPFGTTFIPSPTADSAAGHLAYPHRPMSALPTAGDAHRAAAAASSFWFPSPLDRKYTSRLICAHITSQPVARGHFMRRALVSPFGRVVYFSSSQ